MVGHGPHETHSWGSAPVPLLRASRGWLTILLVVATIVAFASVNAFWQFLSAGRWINLDLLSVIFNILLGFLEYRKAVN